MLKISNSRRAIAKCGELESERGTENLTPARQSSRGEVLLLSLTILFDLGGISVFSWYAVKLTEQVDRYILNSIQSNSEYISSHGAQ